MSRKGCISSKEQKYLRIHWNMLLCEGKYFWKFLLIRWRINTFQRAGRSFVVVSVSQVLLILWLRVFLCKLTNGRRTKTRSSLKQKHATERKKSSLLLNEIILLSHSQRAHYSPSSETQTNLLHFNYAIAPLATSRDSFAAVFVEGTVNRCCECETGNRLFVVGYGDVVVGRRWRSWLWHCATSRKVTGADPSGRAV